MTEISRRSFLQAAAGGALLAAPGLSTRGSVHAQPQGANGDIRVAVAGLHGQGSFHAGQFSRLPGARLVALCDPDSDVLNRQAERAKARNQTISVFTDIRKLLEQKDIDALVIAAPNHWHSLMAVWAVQAGKDVYVEKPVSHNVWEGRKVVEAARKYKRIVQTGTQSRSDEALQQVFQHIWEGNLGKIKIVRGFCYKRRESIGKVDGPQPVPPSVDYDLWTGPAPLQPLLRKELHYDWHWVWETGNGDIGNQGVHEMDMCRWVLREKGLPKRILGFGGRYGYTDDGATPNTQVAYFEYDTPLLFEVRGLPRKTDDRAMDAYQGVRVGIVVECEGGFFAGGGGGGWTYDRQGKRIKQFIGSGGGEGHAANFIRAVRSRKMEDLNADILEGHLSSALCHLANIPYRLGHYAADSFLKEYLAGNAWMADAFQRFEDHLGANGVNLSVAPVVRGPWLEFKPEQERFASGTTYDTGYWANLLLKDGYRPPYIIPDVV
jgi:hypothetical protein